MRSSLNPVKFRLLRPRLLARSLRETARRDPDTASQYLEDHPQEWGSIAESDPHDAADILEALGRESALELIVPLEDGLAAGILEEMDDAAAAEVVEDLPAERATDLIAEMDSDEAVDVLNRVDDAVREELVGALPAETAVEIERLLAYPRDSAGGLMTIEVASLPKGLEAGEAIEALRRLHETLDSLSYVYVVDESERLVGVVSFRELVFARPGTALEDVMVLNPAKVKADADREEVSDIIQRYNLLALPVVDEQERLLGMIPIDEAIEAIQEEASEDMAVMVGAGSEETIRTKVSESIRRRLPWIVVNLLLASIVALTIETQKNVFEDVVILAALMPVVALLGGNSGAQSLAVVIRSMAIQQVPNSMIRQVVVRESRIGLALGAIMSVLAAGIAYLLSGDGGVSLVMAIGVFVSLSIATLAGAGIPIVLRALQFDPALASNIFLTFITDMLGFAGFLMLANLLL